MILAPFFAYVFNDSLQKGHLSPEQKRAIIYPGLKKPSLNPDDLANYRPVSNLSFIYLFIYLKPKCFSSSFTAIYAKILRHAIRH